MDHQGFLSLGFKTVKGRRVAKETGAIADRK